MHDLKTTMTRLGDTPTASQPDLDEVLRTGLRRRRWRQAGALGSAGVTVAAALAVIVTVASPAVRIAPADAPPAPAPTADADGSTGTTDDGPYDPVPAWTPPAGEMTRADLDAAMEATWQCLSDRGMVVLGHGVQGVPDPTEPGYDWVTQSYRYSWGGSTNDSVGEACLEQIERPAILTWLTQEQRTAQETATMLERLRACMDEEGATTLPTGEVPQGVRYEIRPGVVDEQTLQAFDRCSMEAFIDG